MAPLENQLRPGDDPMSPENLHRADVARRARESEDETTRRKRKDTVPGFKVPYAWVWLAWDFVRPKLAGALGTGGVIAILLARAPAAEQRPDAPKPVTEERRVEKLEERLAKIEHDLDAHITAADKRWEKTEAAVDKINEYLLNHKGG